MSSGLNLLMCCICWKLLTPETCAIDILGDAWDCCPGECAEKAGMLTGPINIYQFGQLLWEDYQYEQKYIKQLNALISKSVQESSYDPISELKFSESVGLFQATKPKWD